MRPEFNPATMCIVPNAHTVFCGRSLKIFRIHLIVSVPNSHSLSTFASYSIWPNVILCLHSLFFLIQSQMITPCQPSWYRRRVASFHAVTRLFSYHQTLMFLNPFSAECLSRLWTVHQDYSLKANLEKQLTESFPILLK